MVLSKDIKIAICFGLIMGAIISICNMCFAADYEDIELSYLDGLGIDTNNVLVSSPSTRVAYAEIEPGYQYVFTALNANRRIAFSNSLVVGTSVDNLVTVNMNEDFVFNGSTGYIYFIGVSGSGSIGTLKRTELSGLPNFVDNLAYDLSYANLSGVLFFVVPIMAIGILVALGLYLLKRLLNKIKRAKGGA